MTARRTAVVGQAVRWASDEPQPGLVEARLRDVRGRKWVFIGKAAVSDAASGLSPAAPRAVVPWATYENRSADMHTVPLVKEDDRWNVCGELF
jgi:hypothetical protein